MTPLEIHLLLNLYVSPCPATCYPDNQLMAPAMVEAVDKFERVGVLKPGFYHSKIMAQFWRRKKSEQFLTAKGMLLVERLMEVQP